MSAPDDGGSYHPDPSDCDIPSPGISIRTHLAAQFAAAWLPIVIDGAGKLAYDRIDAGSEANRLGLAMADDLLRLLKGES